MVPLNDSLGAFIEALEREVRLSKVAIYCAAALSPVLFRSCVSCELYVFMVLHVEDRKIWLEREREREIAYRFYMASSEISIKSFQISASTFHSSALHVFMYSILFE